VQVHLALFVVAAENPGEFAFKGYNRAVEDAVGCGNQVARDDGVGAVTPDRVAVAGGSLFPGNVGDNK
jgi:hypothetical protein